MEIPALFRVPESSFNVALLGSTPRVKEKSFVAKSITGRCVVSKIILVCRGASEILESWIKIKIGQVLV